MKKYFTKICWVLNDKIIFKIWKIFSLNSSIFGIKLRLDKSGNKNDKLKVQNNGRIIRKWIKLNNIIKFN